MYIYSHHPTKVDLLRSLNPEVLATPEIENEFKSRFQRMFCSKTPKLILVPFNDGTTWAKQSWMPHLDWNESQVKINGTLVRDCHSGTMRIPEVAYICIESAIYIWFQKYPQGVNAQRPKPFEHPSAAGVNDWWNMRPLIEAALSEEGTEETQRGPSQPRRRKPDSRQETPSRPVKQPRLFLAKPAELSHSVQARLLNRPNITSLSRSPELNPLPKNGPWDYVRLPEPLDMFLKTPTPAAVIRDKPADTRSKLSLRRLLDMALGDRADVTEKVGHFHHHHRPTTTLLDHKWRIYYFSHLRPDAFPWPKKGEKTGAQMWTISHDMFEKYKESDPEEAAQWSRFSSILSLGERSLNLWYNPILQRRQTMTCLSSHCENLRQSVIKHRAGFPYNDSRVHDVMIWNNGASHCPVDCKLREFDCPFDCTVKHTHPLGLPTAPENVFEQEIFDELDLDEHEKAVNAVGFFGLTDESWKAIGPPPFYWMPQRPLPGFWNLKNIQTQGQVNYRIQLLEQRFLQVYNPLGIYMSQH